MQLINDNKYIIIIINVIKIINLLLHNTFIASYDQVTEVRNIIIHSKNRHVSVINHKTDRYVLSSSSSNDAVPGGNSLVSFISPD